MKPVWIRTKFPKTKEFNRISSLLNEYKINTVCRSARCPNIGECFSRNNVTFMILGDICTRRCSFCSVNKGIPLLPDKDEAGKITRVVGMLGLTYVIITSVTRDDLYSGGADIFSELVNKLKKKYPAVKIEILTPDFLGKVNDELLDSKPYIWAHNIETVPRLYNNIRPKADYKRSINLLKSIKLKRDDILTKSGIMLGLGEERTEVLSVFSDLRNAGVDIITISQYLKPSRDCVDVERFLSPDEFVWYRDKALEFGFKSALSGPLVRSSYRNRGGLEEDL